MGKLSFSNRTLRAFVSKRDKFVAEIFKHCSAAQKKEKFSSESRSDCMFKHDYLVYHEIKLEP